MQQNQTQNSNDPVEIVNQAFASLEATINGLKRPQTEQLESVAELFAAGVSHQQIAQMYATRIDGRVVGPFHTVHQNVDINLLELEKNSPGSVLKPGWQHPRYVAALEKFEAVRKAIRDRLEGLQVSLQGLLSSLDDGEPVPTGENAANANSEGLASESSVAGEASVDPRQKVLNALRELPQGETESSLRDAVGMSGERIKPVLQGLRADGLVEPCEVQKRGQVFPGWKLASVPAGSAS